MFIHYTLRLSSLYICIIINLLAGLLTHLSYLFYLQSEDVIEHTLALFLELASGYVWLDLL
jgi:hypothetical protein